MRDTVLAYQSNTEMESQELLKLTERERQKTVAEFRELHQLLDAEENGLLAQMEEVDKEIVRKRDERMARLSEELSSLDGIIQELEGKCQQMARELLEDGGNILRRCEQKEKFEIPVGFPPGLKWRAWDFCGINSILKDVMHNFKASLKAGHPQRKGLLAVCCSRAPGFPASIHPL
ncbi:tripartite motif-containing protein 10-like isoform X4 [Tiliqua scincoides]|uniref:tripartite motif-containing protein 10-like isoform X4 n=1 Tax=Tiliqua scincoides TaxID=71010 RepID=UPI003461C377